MPDHRQLEYTSCRDHHENNRPLRNSSRISLATFGKCPCYLIDIEQDGRWLCLVFAGTRGSTDARAKPNEYIFLHEFHRLKYICSDKSRVKNPDDDGESATTVVTKSGQARRHGYEGGPVFEPKRGL